MDKPVHECPVCRRDQGSKFALKRHRALCGGSLTGRWPTEPNIQNIPVRTETGRAIRDAFADKVELATRETKYHRFLNK